ncbi:MAG: PIG-L family deacetylase, partial [Clostridiales bacterium]|nr:PIG-L family deacetylase [Clostridiales bacterium]
MRVLAIGCHPDDLEIACGGTLRKYVEQGAEVYMCHVANGNQGHVVIEPGPLGELRTKEAERAGAIIGAKHVFNLDIGDMLVDSHNPDAMNAVADVVRFAKPEVIITH